MVTDFIEIVLYGSVLNLGMFFALLFTGII